MTYISVGLRILLSIAFLGAGGAKLAGVDMMVMTFDQIGWGQGFRFLTGAIEVIGVALLWLPRRQVIGAAVLGGTMLGAVLTHWLILGPSAVPAMVLGLLCSAVLYIYRTQIPEVLGRANSSQANL
ncbi:DoxX family protein [Amylibacter sp.]|nr:DoxX family protein [Amylibacter sp.]